MVKSAGFLKKLKKLGNIIGKGVSWVNNNIVKPLNPLLDTALDFVPYGGTIKTVKNTISNGIDQLLPSAPTDNRVQEGVKFMTDFALDSQRSKKDKKYSKYYDSLW